MPLALCPRPWGSFGWGGPAHRLHAQVAEEEGGHGPSTGQQAWVRGAPGHRGKAGQEPPGFEAPAASVPARQEHVLPGCDQAPSKPVFPVFAEGITILPSF